MSNLEQYLGLWQQKRNELPISYDVQADWTDMHSLLDQQMPVVNADASNVSSNSGTTNVVKQLSHFAKFKLIYIAAALITAAAITYLVVKHRAATKNNKPQKTELRKDRVLKSKADSALLNNPVIGNAASNNPLADSAVNSESDKLSNTNFTDKGIAAKTGNGGNNNTADNGSTASNSVAGNINKLNKSTSAANTDINKSRLLASANNIKNGLALNNRHANNSARQGRSNSNGYAGRSANQNDQIVNGESTNGRANQSVIFNADDKTLRNPQQTYIAPLQPSPIIINADNNLLVNDYTTTGMAKASATQKIKNRINKPPVAKTAKDKTPTGSKLDWGILLGADSKGSFTPKAQNHNVYGSLSPDIYVGLFGTYNFSQHWAFGLQGKFLTPHNLSGSYNYTKHSKTSKGLDSVNTIQIKDSHKIYTVDIPLYLVYKPTGNFSLKFGPTLSIPVKMVNRSSTYVVDTAALIDTAKNAINNTRFEKKIHYGISAGVGFSYKFLSLDATYNYNFQPQKVSSSLGGYTANTNSLQLTIGFRLNKKK